MEITKKFAQFIASATYDDLPEDIRAVAKERLLDTVGAALAGEHGWAGKDAFLGVARELGPGSYAPWQSREGCLNLEKVLTANCAFAHAVELDDGHKNGGCHTGAVVVPMALTLGNGLHRSAKEILTAMVLGYEVAYRILEQLPPAQIGRGFYPSSQIDVFGAATVAGKLYKLEPEAMANALGFAGQQASGFMEITVNGKEDKCIQVGSCAAKGLQAVLYAKAGLKGCLTVLEGKNGYFRAEGENIDLEKVTAGLGKEFRLKDTYSKLYPMCRHAQAPVEAVLDFEEQQPFTPEKVESVWVGTHQVAYNLTGTIKEPRSQSDSKFSIAYGIAAAIRDHSFGMKHLTPAYYEDPELWALAHKVTVVVDPEVQAVYPKKRGARVRVTLKDGRVLERELYDLKASPGNPVGWDVIVQKYTNNMEGILTPERSRAILEIIRDFDGQADGLELEKLLHGAK